jgi:putative glycosyltransferase
VQKARKGNKAERLSGVWYYRFMKLATGYSYPLNTLTSRVMSRAYVNALKMYTEKEFDIWTLFVLNGFKQSGIVLSKKSKGKSTYTLKRKVRMAVDMFTSYSTMPLYWVLSVGLIVLFLACIFCLFLLYQFLNNKVITSSMMITASLWLMGGLVLSALGIICIYLSKMFLEIKNRPVSIIQKIYSSKDGEHEGN